MQDTFYKVRNLTVEQKKAVCDDAKTLATEWWVDVLNCKVSWSRKRVDMPYNEIMSKLTNGCHFVVIHRRYDEPDRDYGEIGFSTMTLGSDYFLWIHITVDDLNKIVQKHQLEAMS